MVVEVAAGPTRGVAVISGIAGGADVILIPEQPMTVEAACSDIERRHRRSKDFSIVVCVNEGYELTYESGERSMVTQEAAGTDEFGHVRLGGVGSALAQEIEARTGFETRVTVLGRVRRGRHPDTATASSQARYSLKAADLVDAGAIRPDGGAPATPSSTSRSKRPRSSRPCRRSGTRSRAFFG